jgi:hypothetical protein
MDLMEIIAFLLNNKEFAIIMFTISVVLASAEGYRKGQLDKKGK